jgi:rod shape-determining protein MreD
MRISVYILLGLCFILLQVSVFPRILPFHLKPDLLLILVIYLGLSEDYLRGGLLSYFLGCLQDVFAGIYPGLYGFAMLLIFMIVRGAAGRLNSESSVLLLLMVFLGTFLEGALILFSLGFFADVSLPWSTIPARMMLQVLLNLAVALLVLKWIPFLHRHLAPRLGTSGQPFDSYHE